MRTVAADQATAQTPCPDWCQKDHLPSWRVHQRRVWTHENPFSGDVLDVFAVQYHDGKPCVDVTSHSDAETVASMINPETALHLAATLRSAGQGGAFADALDEAAQTILGDKS